MRYVDGDEGFSRIFARLADGLETTADAMRRAGRRADERLMEIDPRIFSYALLSVEIALVVYVVSQLVRRQKPVYMRGYEDGIKASRPPDPEPVPAPESEMLTEEE